MTVDDMERSARKIETIPQSILQIAGVGEMGELRVVAEHHKRRRVHRDLVRIEDLQTPMVELRGRVHVLSI